MAGAVHGLARLVDIDAAQRGGQPVGIAFAPDFAVRDDVDPRALHVADRDQRGIVLRLLEERLGDAPHLLGAHPRRQPAAEIAAVHQPVGLNVRADHGGRQDRQCHGAVPLREVLVCARNLHAAGVGGKAL
jgi:hypothetical protein